MFGQRRVQADVRVGHLLDQLGIRYQIDEDGDYRVVFELSNGRSQQAFIDSQTQHLAATKFAMSGRLVILPTAIWIKR